MRLITFMREQLQATPWLTPGFHRATREEVEARLDTQPCHLARRELVEEDESFLQAVAYAVVQRPDGLVFAYQRSKLEGEQRLHGNWSVGVGGHVELGDATCTAEAPDDFGRYITSTIRAAAERELTEELGLVPMAKTTQLVGVVYDDSNAVGRVHLGFVFRAETLDMSRAEELMPPPVRTEFALPGVLLERELETWSRLVLEAPGLPWSQGS